MIVLVAHIVRAKVKEVCVIFVIFACTLEVCKTGSRSRHVQFMSTESTDHPDYPQASSKVRVVSADCSLCTQNSFIP